MNPILTLDKIPEADASNVYGYDKIHIYAFNFDGEGSALVAHDEENEFVTYSGVDLTNILMGDPYDGTRWYKPALRTKSI